MFIEIDEPFVCEHCGKRLGRRIVQVSYSAKELGLRMVKR